MLNQELGEVMTHAESTSSIRGQSWLSWKKVSEQLCPTSRLHANSKQVFYYVPTGGMKSVLLNLCAVAVHYTPTIKK